MDPKNDSVSRQLTCLVPIGGTNFDTARSLPPSEISTYIRYLNHHNVAIHIILIFDAKNGVIAAFFLLQAIE
jgi:hypothetical protein